MPDHPVTAFFLESGKVPAFSALLPFNKMFFRGGTGEEIHHPHS